APQHVFTLDLPTFEGAAFAWRVTRGGDDAQAFAPMRVAVHLVVTTCHGAPVEKELGPVCVGVLDRVVVEVLVDVLASVMASAAGLGFDRPGTFHPGTL